MANERVSIVSTDIAYGQLAPSQAARTAFTPGKATSQPGDENWAKDHRIPTGTPAFSGEAAGPVLVSRERVFLTGRGIICDQPVLAPVSGTPCQTVVTSPKEWGTVTPTSTLTPTDTQDANGKQEHGSGGDNIESA